MGAVLEVGSYDQNGNVSAWWDGGMDAFTGVPGGCVVAITTNRRVILPRSLIDHRNRKSALEISPAAASREPNDGPCPISAVCSRDHIQRCPIAASGLRLGRPDLLHRIQPL